MPERTGFFTDLYEFAMAQSYVEHDVMGEATFDLHVRQLPPRRGYLVSAGVNHALGRLERFSFGDGMLSFLEERGFSEDLTDALDGLNVADEVRVRGIPEGRLVFPYEPVLEVTGPLPWAQLAETILLNAVQVGMLTATKAARCVHAAGSSDGPQPVLVDFGARRAHGEDAAHAAARGAYLAGFAGTSLVEASRAYGIPCFGTMAHSYVQAFEDEERALDAFASSYPDGTTLLVDTFDTMAGLEKAIRVAKRLEDEGGSLGGVRIDSGDLGKLASRTRERLDEEGLGGVDVFVSGGLDEDAIEELLGEGAPVSGMGVGTRLVTSQDAPSLDLVYKLVEFEGEPVTKLSKGKHILPGRKSVGRRAEEDRFVGDVLGQKGEGVEGEPLLVPLRARDPRQAIEEARSRFRDEFNRLPDEIKDNRDPATYVVERSAGLEEATKAGRSRARSAAGLG